MPASPIPPEQQAEIDTLRLITSTLKNRGTYVATFAEAVKSLNAVCARIFHDADPEQAPSVDAKDWA